VEIGRAEMEVAAVSKVNLLLNTIRPKHLNQKKIKNLKLAPRERIPVAQSSADLQRLEATLAEQISNQKPR
jgi:hypothetical protein